MTGDMTGGIALGQGVRGSYSVHNLLGWTVVLLVCTGANSALPGSGFLMLALGLAALALNPLLRERPGELLLARMLLGAAIFNVVFLMYGVSHSLEGRIYLIHLYSLLWMCLAFALASGAWRAMPDRQAQWAQAICAVGLIVLLFGQWAQIKGWIVAPDERFERRAELAAALRPGGFLNPNTTAAIALALLYASGLHRRRVFTLFAACICLLATTVVALTQSRAALLALAICLVVIGRRHPLRLLLIAIVFGAGGWMTGAWDAAGVLFEVFDRFAGRFSGDASSSERAYILRRAWEAIQEAPLFGQGYGYLIRSYEMGSHNQLTELWVDFGLFGALPMLAAGMLMLGRVSALFVVVCVLPAFVFSHNYFDSAHLQAALGLALASEHWVRRARPMTAPRGSPVTARRVVQ